MQNAKDTFYEMLRGRVAAGNADRTVVVRGTTRPGVLVVENELVTDAAVLDGFALTWGEVKVDARGAMPMVAMSCGFGYQTAGTGLNAGMGLYAGMDRGRALSAMDGELLAALRAWPREVPKTNYAGLAFGQSAVTMGTNVWWGEVSFGDVVVEGERLKRTASVAVMCFQEAGEL